MQQCLVKKKQDTLGFKVVGDVTNLGPANANSVTVSATFYDLDHKVVDTDYAFTNLETIPPGKKASFEISILSDNAKNIKSVGLNTRSNEYTLSNIQDS